MRIHGFLIKAQAENVSSDLTDTLPGLFWLNTTSGFLKYYSGGVKEIVDTTSTQTLSGKTLSGIFFDLLDLAHQATPANPTSNRSKVYVKADNKVYSLDSNGNERRVGFFDVVTQTINNSATDVTISGTTLDGAVDTVGRFDLTLIRGARACELEVKAIFRSGTWELSIGEEDSFDGDFSGVTIGLTTQVGNVVDLKYSSDNFVAGNMIVHIRKK